MSNCKICSGVTKNKIYCSMKCRDIGRRTVSKEIRKCKMCQNTFECYKKSNKKYCSTQCVTQDDEIIIKKINSAKITNLQRYGVDNPAKSEIVKDKIKQTNLQKYGTEYSWQSEIVKDKIKQTNLQKYGVEYPQQNELISGKSTATFIEKYGGRMTEEMIRIGKKTKLELYGDENYQNRDKIKQTNLQKYGVEHPLQSKNIQIKKNNTLKQKYNVINISQVESVSKKIKKSLMNNTYDRLITEDKYVTEIIPMFTKEEYTGGQMLYDFKCVKCNNIFQSKIENGAAPRCLNCYPKHSGTSKPEQEIADYIASIYDGTIERNTKDIIPPLELDIYIPDLKIAIEFDDIYWHSELNGKDKKYHLAKTNACEQFGIRLLHIFESEWINTPEIVKSILKLRLTTVDQKVFARKCELREVSAKNASEFLQKYHLQGKDHSSVRYGLYYNNELIQLLTFCQARFNNTGWEISRSATKTNTLVVGGISKLFKHFVEQHSPKEIITFCDRRYFNGNGYKQIGFEFNSYTQPAYFYFKHPDITLSNRQSFQKHKLPDKLSTFDINLTEWENMTQNGYDRIWDCGHSKWIWKN